MSVRTLLAVSNACVRSVLEYDVSVWCDWTDEWPEAERVQRRFAKWLLSLPDGTTTVGLYAELGMHELQLHRLVLRLRFLWTVLTARPDCVQHRYCVGSWPLAFSSNAAEQEHACPWVLQTVQCLRALGCVSKDDVDGKQIQQFIMSRKKEQWFSYVDQHIAVKFVADTTKSINAAPRLSWLAANVLPTLRSSWSALFLATDGVSVGQVSEIVQMRLAVSPLLSHFPSQIGKVAADQCACRLCDSGEESVEHLFVCPLLDAPRLKFFSGLQSIWDFIHSPQSLPLDTLVMYLLCHVHPRSPRVRLSRLVAVSCDFLKSCLAIYKTC
jgi:hypothetical protein